MKDIPAISVDMSHIVRGLTATVVIRGQRRYRMRVAIAMVVMRFASWILGCNFDGHVEIGRVTRIDGKPLERGEDGLIRGEPLNLTDEDRAALPRLEPADDDAPMVFGIGKAVTR
jgi:hypothetical protein